MLIYDPQAHRAGIVIGPGVNPGTRGSVTVSKGPQGRHLAGARHMSPRWGSSNRSSWFRFPRAVRPGLPRCRPYGPEPPPGARLRSNPLPQPLPRLLLHLRVELVGRVVEPGAELLGHARLGIAD